MVCTSFSYASQRLVCSHTGQWSQERASETVSTSSIGEGFASFGGISLLLAFLLKVEGACLLLDSLACCLISGVQGEGEVIVSIPFGKGSQPPPPLTTEFRLNIHFDPWGLP